MVPRGCRSAQHHPDRTNVAGPGKKEWSGEPTGGRSAQGFLALQRRRVCWLGERARDQQAHRAWPCSAVAARPTAARRRRNRRRRRRRGCRSGRQRSAAAGKAGAAKPAKAQPAQQRGGASQSNGLLAEIIVDDDQMAWVAEPCAGAVAALRSPKGVF